MQPSAVELEILLVCFSHLSPRASATELMYFTVVCQVLCYIAALLYHYSFNIPSLLGHAQLAR